MYSNSNLCLYIPTLAVLSLCLWRCRKTGRCQFSCRWKQQKSVGCRQSSRGWSAVAIVIVVKHRACLSVGRLIVGVQARLFGRQIVSISARSLSGCDSRCVSAIIQSYCRRSSTVLVRLGQQYGASDGGDSRRIGAIIVWFMVDVVGVSARLVVYSGRRHIGTRACMGAGAVCTGAKEQVVVIFRVRQGQAGSNWCLGENLVLTFRTGGLIGWLV